MVNFTNELLPPLSLTPRDARLPMVPGKAHAVIGMRRAGKSTFLRQLLSDRRRTLPPECAIYLSFDDDFLAQHPVTGEALIQVCADPSAPETLERELRALEKSVEVYPGAERLLLVLDLDAQVAVQTDASRARVRVQPVYEWMLLGG